MSKPPPIRQWKLPRRPRRPLRPLLQRHNRRLPGRRNRPQPTTRPPRRRRPHHRRLLPGPCLRLPFPPRLRIQTGRESKLPMRQSPLRRRPPRKPHRRQFRPCLPAPRRHRIFPRIHRRLSPRRLPHLSQLLRRLRCRSRPRLQRRHPRWNQLPPKSRPRRRTRPPCFRYPTPPRMESRSACSPSVGTGTWCWCSTGDSGDPIAFSSSGSCERNTTSSRV